MCPLRIAAGPERPKKQSKKQNEGHPCTMYGVETILTISRLRCQLHKSLLIPLCRDLTHSPGHIKRLGVKLQVASPSVGSVRVGEGRGQKKDGGVLWC